MVVENFPCRKKWSKNPWYRLWTFPVIVDGPFGVVSAAELIGILLFSMFTIWAIYAYTLANFNILSKFQLSFIEERYITSAALTAYDFFFFLYLGLAGY